MHVSERDVHAVSRIWSELADFPASDIDAALAHALRELTRTIGATNGFWVAARRDAEASRITDPRAWRIVATAQLDSSAERRGRVAEQAARFAAGDVDPQTQAILAHAGRTRAFLRPELVDDHEWENSWLYNEILRPLAVGDRLLGSHTIDTRHESYIGLERGINARPFGERERDVLNLFLLGAGAFHREAMRAFAPACSLTPREHEVLCLLLTGMAEREIAWQLSLTPRTTHQYVVAILRKFGLHGRVELMAHFLRAQ
ncbi:MAG TPA: helix-turn-helix transcriptional regulator [Candidatus Baltobacteraceae bacterium]|nr:helix-turn-helix transcriptional regulator [Candidatus Baltobacteraceae bacterium]